MTIRTSWYDYGKRMILRQLSENSRMSVNSLSKMTRSSVKTTSANMQSLENDFGMHYTLEFEDEVHRPEIREIFAIKFKTKPKKDEIIRIFKPPISFLALTEGSFDLFAIVSVYNRRAYPAFRAQMLEKLSKYKPTIRSSVILNEKFGFLKLQDWEIEHLDIQKFGLLEEDRNVLIYLNENSRATYKEVARALKIHATAAKYRMNRIGASGIIKRHTILLRRPPTDYNMCMIIDTDHSSPSFDPWPRAKEYYSRLDQKLPLINNFQYVANVTGRPFSFFVVGAFESEKKYNNWGVLAHEDLFKDQSPVIAHVRFLEVIEGSLPIRSIEMR